MPFRLRFAFGCYALVALAIVVLGAFYAGSSKILPYHQQVLGVSWDALGMRYQALFLALLRGGGFCALGCGLSMWALLLVPFRRQERWARGLILLIGLCCLGPSCYYTAALKLSTGAATPWQLPPAGVALLFAGFILSKDLGRKKP